MRVLLVGHACSPVRGSEHAITWGWAWHLSAFHKVWLISHPQCREEVEEFLTQHPNPNLRCVWVTPSSKLDYWNPAQGDRGLWLHYLLWQRAVFKEASRICGMHRFDVAHQVSLGTVIAPPLLWRLPAPFIWGPVGGGQTAPPTFRSYFGISWPKEAIRNLRTRLLPFLPALRRAVHRSATILAANQETARLLEKVGAQRVRLFCDSGSLADHMPANLPKREHREECILLWAGRLEHRKALPLSLEALAQIGNLPVRLLVAGDGPLRAEWEGLADSLGVKGRVQFLGRVTWEKMTELYRQADIFLFTSLRDTFGSQVLEAMAQALPIIALDHHGVRDFVPPEAGFKVPVTTPDQTVAALAQAIRLLVQSSDVRYRMGEFALAYAKEQTWTRRVEQVNRCYEECVSRQRSKSSI